MLMRLILLLVQLAVGWFGGQYIMSKIAPLAALGDPARLFVYAVVFAIVIFVIGLLAAAVLRDIRSPTAGTLTFSLILGFVGAGLTLVDPVMAAIKQAGVNASPLLLPLLGAALGYFVKR